MNIVLLETLYMILVTVPCIIIFLRTKRIFDFSRHKGVDVLSKAFLFLAIGFFFRYIVMILRATNLYLELPMGHAIMTFFMEYLLMLPGFLFLYTYSWKQVGRKWPLVYVLPALIALTDVILGWYHLMYVSQIIVFFISAILTSRKKGRYMWLVSLSMTLFLFVWVLNFVAQLTIDRFAYMRMVTYALTATASYLLLYMIFKLTRDF